MRIGLAIADFRTPRGSAGLGAALAQVARSAEAAGFDSLWVWDHQFYDESPVGPGMTDRPMIEAYTTLGYLAGVTKTIQLGTMVTGVTYRHPGVLIKQVTTLDVLSGGRAWLGIGAAWFDEEHRALGIPFPPAGERFDRLEETLQIAHQMWSDAGDYGTAKPFKGQYYQLERTLNVPAPVQRPHPPILIGGNGERRTLHLVAAYGDACNIFAASMPELERLLNALRGHCERLGRPYEAIQKTFYSGLGRSIGYPGPARVIEHCQELAAHGIEMIVFDHHQLNYYDGAEVNRWQTEIIPSVHSL